MIGEAGISARGATDRASVRARPFRSRSSRRRPAWAIALNLTSMIDLVFLLLFFFLAASRFTPPEGTLPADLPGRGAARTIELPRTPLQVRLTLESADAAACRLTIDRFHPEPLPIADLAATLLRLREQVPGLDARTPVYLLADERVAWDHVVNAYNAAITARFRQVFFAGGER